MAAAAHSLHNHLDGKVGELRKLVQLALESGSREAVHRARVITRRLKAALDLLEPVLPARPRKEMVKALRRVRHSLGSLRDLDVMLMHLREMRSNRRIALITPWLERCLRRERKELRLEAAKKHPAQELFKHLGVWETVRQGWCDSDDATRALIQLALGRQLSAFAARASRLSPQAMGQAGAKEDVHQLRIAGKLLRYTLELAEPLGYELSNSVLVPFKSLQDALGLWHDYVALGQRALHMALKEMLPLHQPVLYGQALELALYCWRQSQRRLAQFSAIWARECSRISSITPLVMDT